MFETFILFQVFRIHAIPLRCGNVMWNLQLFKIRFKFLCRFLLRRDSSSSEGKLPGPPLESVFNLEARVSQLEAELRKEQHSKQVLAAKVANLQQENRFLQEQSTTTQNQFKKFAEWLRSSGTVHSDSSNKGRKSEGNGSM